MWRSVLVQGDSMWFWLLTYPIKILKSLKITENHQKMVKMAKCLKMAECIRALFWYSSSSFHPYLFNKSNKNSRILIESRLYWPRNWNRNLYFFVIFMKISRNRKKSDFSSLYSNISEKVGKWSTVRPKPGAATLKKSLRFEIKLGKTQENFKF